MNTNIDKDMVKIIQVELNNQFDTTLDVDGVYGTNTRKVLERVSVLSTEWDDDRKIIGYIQYLCDKNDINAGVIDGLWGPQTDYAYGQLKGKLQGAEPEPWRDDEGIGLQSDPNMWPPQTQEALVQYYGEPGTNQTKVNVPYPLMLAWDTSTVITRFACHEKVAPSIERVLKQVLKQYGAEMIDDLGLNLFGGCLNVRKMRGGTTWSTHAWGIAIDWDPTRNKLRWNKDNAVFAQRDYDTWWDIWEDEGWVSLGRKRDYDWMHVQASKVK